MSNIDFATFSASHTTDIPALVDDGHGIATAASLAAVEAWAVRLSSRLRTYRDGGALAEQVRLRIEHVRAGLQTPGSGSTASARWLLDELPRHVGPESPHERPIRGTSMVRGDQ